MATELDKIKSTITISLGTKNRLRALKGSMSYEEYINYRLRQEKAEPNERNYIELGQTKRKTAVYSSGNFKVIFSYNQYSKSPNFQFDIIVDKVREDGNAAEFKKLIETKSRDTNMEYEEIEFRIYFELLAEAIKQEIEPLFKHNGRFEDHYSWNEEFKVLCLPENAFEEDVMQKLNHYKQGLHYND